MTFAAAFAACGLALGADLDVRDYGAKADEAMDSTAAIQRAIDECSAKGGGRVMVSGGVYKTYTLNLKNNVDLHIERGATLKGGEDPYKYPEFTPNDVWNSERSPRFNKRAMFYTVGQTNVAITGAGTIDGNAELFHHDTGKKNWTGHSWWRKSDTNITGRCVFFVGCRDVRLDDVLIYHPAGWSTWFLDCDRVGVRGVRIEADKRFPNGDGLHFGGCRDVVVSDCIVDSQDDALVIRTHQEQMKRPRPCERVVVDNCVLRSNGAYAIRIGWRGDGPIKDVSINNIVSTHSRLGVGFTVPGWGKPSAVCIDPPRGRGVLPPPPETLLPFSAENVRFSNMSIESDYFSLVSIGENTSVAHVKDISFSHCRFKSKEAPAVKCRPGDNVRDWRLSDVVFESAAWRDAAPGPEEVFKDLSGFEFDNVKCRVSDLPLFWQLVMAKDGVKGSITVESANQRPCVETLAGGAKRYVYEDLAARGTLWKVKVVVEERVTGDGKKYRGYVENNEPGVRVTRFMGPRLDRLRIDPSKAAIYIVNGYGQRIRHFPEQGKWAGLWKRESGFMTIETGKYPSHALSMPWVAVDTGSGTWYAAVHDAQAGSKNVGFRWYPGEKNVDMRFRHQLSLRTGGRWELPETMLLREKGDWHSAAKRYRAWYDSVRESRAATPDWTRDLTGWLLVIMKQQNEELMWPYTDMPKLCDIAERNGLNCIGLFGWTVGGHDHLYPDYDADPKMGGAEALKAGIAEAHRRGLRVCIYANGQLQQVDATEFWRQHGERLALRYWDGSLYLQTYHKYSNIPVYKFALGCLCGKEWFDRMFSLAEQADGFGADAILYDQLGMAAPRECWGKDHGHQVPWYTYGEERPGFLRRIADGMHERNKDFAVFTEGLHDTVLDSIAFFHGCQFGAFHKGVESVRARCQKKTKKEDAFPELWRYTFPELVSSMRFATPMVPRSEVNYAAVFGLRHEIEVRYMPDRAYVLEGKVPTKEDYGEVKNLPSIYAMHETPQEVANGYLKSVCDLQKAHAKHLMRGRFVDDEGFSVSDQRVVAKRFVAADGTSAVCAWNVSDEPVEIEVKGLGAPTGVFAPGGEGVNGPIGPDSIRLYEFGKAAR